MEEKNTPRRPRRNTDEQPKAAKNESLVYGKNPVTELLKSGSGVDTVLLAEGMAPAVAAYYTAMAKEVGAAVKRVNPNKLRLMTGTDSHQGVAAFASEIEYVTVDDLMENLRGMNYYDIKDIQYAIAETNGKISVFMKPDSQPATCKDVNNVPPDNGMPLVIISDGKISQWALQTVGVDEAWIDQVLIDNACPQDKVFLLTATKTREYYLVRKELA